jgi:hypothetical protein
MSIATVKSDVFLSSSAIDEEAAELVDAALTEQGLDVFRPTKVQPGTNLQEAVWEAIAESAAMVVILPAVGPVSSNALVELGAAMAWHKPIFLVSPSPTPKYLPTFLQEQPVFPIQRLDDVVHLIKSGLSPLSEENIARLTRIYHEMGIPADQLLKKPAAIDLLAKKYNAAASSIIPGEQLISQLFRLRKRGKLPRITGRRRSNEK